MFVVLSLATIFVLSKHIC